MSADTRHALVLCSLVAAGVILVLTGHKDEAAWPVLAMVWYFFLGMP